MAGSNKRMIQREKVGGGMVRTSSTCTSSREQQSSHCKNSFVLLTKTFVM